MSSSRVMSNASTARIANIIIYSLLFSALQHCLAETDDRACYDPSNKVTNHRPCISSSTKAISHCCSTNDTCLGDTLCLSQFGTLYVGSCTIKDWAGGTAGRGDCPKYCRTEGNDIGLCDNTGPDWEFCCGALKGISNCCSGTRFKIMNTTNQYLDQRPFLNGKASTSASPLSSSSSAPTTSASSAESASSAGSSQCPAPTNKNNMGATIGIGVGLGIPLLIALGVLFVENRKRRAAEAQLAPAMSAHHTGGYDGQVVPFHEVEGVKYRGEMPSPAPVHELAAAKHQGHPQM